MLETKELANRTASRFKTRNPYEIAEYFNIVILILPLGDTRGFTVILDRRYFIYINSDLDEPQRALVCAHELGHYLMHREYNRLFMDTRTFMKTSPFEVEAHHFAVDLLYDDADMQQYIEYGPDTTARCLGVSREQAEYRLSTVEPMLW